MHRLPLAPQGRQVQDVSLAGPAPHALQGEDAHGGVRRDLLLQLRADRRQVHRLRAQSAPPAEHHTGTLLQGSSTQWVNHATLQLHFHHVYSIKFLHAPDQEMH